MLRSVPVGDHVIGALFVLVAAVASTFVFDFGPRWPYTANLAIHLGLIPAVWLRRVRPVPAFVATYALLAGLGALVNVSPVNLGISPALFAAPLAVLAITRHGPSPQWGYVAVVLGVLGSFASPVVRIGGVSAAGVAAHVLLIVGSYLWAAQQRQIADRFARDLAEQARAHEARAARGVEAERTMIAREVHDIVAHNLAVVRVQAATALAIGGEGLMREALTTIKDVTGNALGETRELVGALRSPEASVPAGDLTALPALVARARGSMPGLTVTVPDAATLAAWQDAWSARTRLTVLRVAQEALTNMIRHGAAGDASFEVSRRDDRIIVQAHNTARNPTDTPGGHGLAGIRERVELAGGTLEVAPQGQGFTLRATIPVTGPMNRPGHRRRPKERHDHRCHHR